MLYLVKEIHWDGALSEEIIMDLMDKNQDLETIRLKEDVYFKMPNDFFKLLSERGVKVRPIAKRGRPKKYEEIEIKLIQKMLDNGTPPKEISDLLRIPLKSVYYLKKDSLKRGRRSKYSLDTKNKVKMLYAEGVSTAKISEDMNIPRRTIYDILKE